MLDAITSFFESRFSTQEDNSQEQTEHQLRLASAALMIELCKSDRDIDDAETATLVGILKQRFDLSQEDLSELMTLAEAEARDSTSLYPFTSLMNEHFDYGQKALLVRNLWEVAYADGKIDRYEEHLIRKVSDLLYLSHVDFIKGKQQARELAENQL